MEPISIVERFQTAHDNYFRLLLQHYPTLQQDGLFTDFGPPEMCELAIEVHASAIALGPVFLRRMAYVGFKELYAFDNPVDMYNWRARIKRDRIDHTVYASIAIRIDAELKRIRKLVELGGEARYDTLAEDDFLVSKDRYESFAVDGPREPRPAETNSPAMAVHIGTINYANAVDAPAVSSLEQLEKRTTVWSNFSNIVSTLRTLLGG